MNIATKFIKLSFNTINEIKHNPNNKKGYAFKIGLKVTISIVISTK